MPGGLHRNRQFRLPMIVADSSCPEWLLDVLFDPQTAGGLLIAVASQEAPQLVRRLHAAGVSEATVIGEVAAEPRNKILLR